MKNILKKFRYALKAIAPIFWQGEIEKQCPCCGHLGCFDTYGHPPRYGSLCPNCGSLERHRLLILADQKEDFFSGKDVLHFAPETILSRFIVKRAKKYLTADLTPGRADCIMNIERIGQPDESWDVVVCSHVLEHVDDRVALVELHRILRKGALLVTMVPIIEGWETTYEDLAIKSEQDRHWHFGQFDHLRYYGRDIRNRLKNAGFNIREHTASGSDAVKYGLLRGEKVFVCIKNLESAEHNL